MRFIILGLLVLSISACATGYKRMGDGGTVMGYDETPLSKGQYRVTYRGQQGQSPTEVYSLFLRRAAELAKKDGAPFFKVTEGQQSNEITNTFAGMTMFPHYSGNVILLQKEETGAVNATEVLSRYEQATAQASQAPAPEATPRL